MKKTNRITGFLSMSALLCGLLSLPVALAAAPVLQEDFEKGTVGEIERVPTAGDAKSPSIPPVDEKSKWVGLILGDNKLGYQHTETGLKAGDKVTIKVSAINDNADGDPRGFVMQAYIKKTDNSVSRRMDVTSGSNRKWETVKIEFTVEKDEASMNILFLNGFKQAKSYVDDMVIDVTPAK